MKGLFQQTLPAFLEEWEPAQQLILHNDSDLYSATLYVLSQANKILGPGAIVIFDEFYGVMHEFRALEDYCSSYMRSYEVIGATHDFRRKSVATVAIRMR